MGNKSSNNSNTESNLPDTVILSDMTNFSKDTIGIKFHLGPEARSITISAFGTPQKLFEELEKMDTLNILGFDMSQSKNFQSDVSEYSPEQISTFFTKLSNIAPKIRYWDLGHLFISPLGALEIISKSDPLYLSLSRSKIDSSILSKICTLSQFSDNIRYLNLSISNNLNDISSLWKLQNLCYLDVSATTKITSASFPQMPSDTPIFKSLEGLNINTCDHLDEKIFDFLSQCPNLTFLNLYGCSALKSLPKPIPSLRYLTASNCTNVDQSSLCAFLAQSKLLHSVDLSRIPWEKSTLSTLLKSLSIGPKDTIKEFTLGGSSLITADFIDDLLKSIPNVETVALPASMGLKNPLHLFKHASLSKIDLSGCININANEMDKNSGWTRETPAKFVWMRTAPLEE